MLTEEQRKKRRNGIGASDSAIIMGYSSYKTPYQLYLEKRGVVSDDDEQSELQYWGNALEPVIVKRFEEETGLKVSFPDTVYHKDYPFIFANLDGWIESENAVLEIKCANSFQRHEWDVASADGIPLKYLIQIAKQVMIMQADKGYCAVLIGGNEYKQFVYERDEGLEKIILQADIEFWDCVQKGIEPNPVNTNDCRLKYPQAKADSTAQSTFSTTSCFMELQAIKEKSKLLSKQEEHCKTILMAHMGNCEYLVELSGEVMATWKSTKKGNRVFIVKGAAL